MLHAYNCKVSNSIPVIFCDHYELKSSKGARQHARSGKFLRIESTRTELKAKFIASIYRLWDAQDF